uniref:Reticulon n=1 Tax=Pseudonaja textilis TaxID=8673 RepID=A0A670YR92_PSETE
LPFIVDNLIFWRDVKKTGTVFSTTLILLLSLAAFSVISVVSYLILALLSVTICFRVYKSVIQAVQKSEDDSLQDSWSFLAVVMWLMTYVGAIFNGITLLILGKLQTEIEVKAWTAPQ